jgi:hypothetical protein
LAKKNVLAKQGREIDSGRNIKIRFGLLVDHMRGSLLNRTENRFSFVFLFSKLMRQARDLAEC